MSSRKILIIEDNEDMAQLLALHLKDLRHSVELCIDGDSGLQKTISNQYDLIILDLMLPGCDGLSICKSIRTNPKYTAILILTAKGSEFERVTGLESGADDYVTKPFSLTELLARIKSIFRRMDAIETTAYLTEPSIIIHHGAMSIDSNKRKVTLGRTTVNLTAKEFDLLFFFASHPERVYTRNELLDRVWGYGHDGYEHTVNSHINRLRVKIETDPKQPIYIQTVWGVGYKFSDEKNHA